MLIRVVRMTFREDEAASFLNIYKNAQSEIRNYPGCRHLELWRDSNHPYIFTTYSHWDSEEVLNQYRHSAFFAQVWSETKSLFSAAPQTFSSVVVSF